jgi:cytochrome c-type biogenesis protein CcmE
MSTKWKLTIAALTLISVCTFLACVGAMTSWRYYVMVDEGVANAAELAGQRLRVNGRVAPHSLQISEDRLQANFVLLGNHDHLNVTCSGPLPDNFKENMDVVVEGTLDRRGHLHGDKLMTRCASKYEAKNH